MKYIFLLFTLTSLNVKAQYKYLLLDNGQFYFEKVYQIDSLPNSKIESALIDNIPRILDLKNFNKTSELITANIGPSLIDYKKYGGKWSRISVFMNHPFRANVLIVWKDGRYKVTVNNIIFDVAGYGQLKGAEAFSDNALTFSKAKINIEAARYFERYLSELFEIKKTNSDW